MTELSINKKNGYLAVCRAIFRMNYQVDKCLEVFASLVFDRGTSGFKNLMVIDENMLISGISEAGTDFFQKNTFIYQYNKKFRSIFSSIDYVSNFRLKNGNIEMETIMEDIVILHHYRVYFNFLNGQEVEVLDKMGNKTLLFMQIKVSYMPIVGRYAMFVEFRQIILDTVIDNTLLDPKPLFMLDFYKDLK